MEKSELVKTVLTGAAPFISAITETFLKPKLKEVSEKMQLTKNNVTHIFENKFNEYLTRSYEKYSIMNTIVFHNQQKLLKDLYVPLTVINSQKEQFTIDKYSSKFLPVYQRILITDTAGMGKSTLMKKIFLSIIDESIGIPVLIELRRISRQKDIIEEIMEQFNSISKDIDKNFILHLIQRGDFIFLLDGYDEIPEEERKFTTKQIQTFVNKAGNNKFILTSRPEHALTSFGDFKEFKVKPLQKLEAFKLLEKYDNSDGISKKLIAKLNHSSYKNIDEFLTNPLLVSLLFAAFEHKQTIPIKKHIFYRQVYDALFESHDLTKGDSFARDKFSKLDIDEFHRVLRHIGYNCLIKGKIEFTKDEILILIREAKQYTNGISFKESDFLKDIINTVPLFTIDGIYYKWSHKSLQEYFAANFIFVDSKEMQKEILLKLYHHKNSEKFLNVLDLYYSIDYKSFSEVIIFQLLSDFFRHLKNSYKGIKNEAKKERQLITFGYDFVLIKSNLTHDDVKGANEVWTKMVECIGRELDNWTLTIKLGPNEEHLDNIKVPVRKNIKAQLLAFLQIKKEKFVMLYKPKIDDTPLKLAIDTQKAYLITDDKNSILNTKENFKITNNLILNYNGRRFLTINEKEALKYLKSIKASIDAKTLDKLLDF